MGITAERFGRATVIQTPPATIVAFKGSETLKDSIKFLQTSKLAPFEFIPSHIKTKNIR